MVFIEAGCGCGNTIFALAKTFPNWKLHGMDFSKNAIALLRQRSEESGISVGIEVADLTSDQLESNFPPADLISLIFILSSISKENHIKVVQNTKMMLKQGGSVIVRDYAANDHAMLRFGRNSRIGERFYARQDGTRAYYFFTDELRIIFEECGFQTAKCDYIYRRTENIKEQISIDRVFVEGRFVLK